MELVSQREYARRISSNPGYVNKLVKRGVIPLIDGMIDPEAADKAIAAARDPQKSYMREVNDRQRAAFRGDAGDYRPEPQSSANSAYHKSKTANEFYRAKQAELEWHKAVGSVISAEEQKEVSFRRYRAIRDKLINIPDRISTVVAAERDPVLVHAIITAEIKRVLNDLATDAKSETSAGDTERVAA